MSENQPKLDVHVGVGDLIHLTIGGNLKADNFSALNDWIKQVKDTVKSQYENIHRPVLCLADITELKEYDPEAITKLAELMKENEPFVLRTATFGGNKSIVMAEDVVIALSGRKNLKGFATKDEAVKWLREGGETGETVVEI